MDADSQTKKILFVTNAESGQANTVLALALEASMRQQVRVHVASFPALKQRVERLSPMLNFHPLDGENTVKIREEPGVFEQNLPHPPVTKGFGAYDKLLKILWDGERTFFPFFLV